MPVAALVATLLGQSSSPDASGSNPAVLIVGVVIVTGIVVAVVARQAKR